MIPLNIDFGIAIEYWVTPIAPHRTAQVPLDTYGSSMKTILNDEVLYDKSYERA